MKSRLRFEQFSIVRWVRFVSGESVKLGEEVSRRPPDRWRVWRFSGQMWDWRLPRLLPVPDEERGKRREVRFLRGAIACRRSWRGSESDIKDRSRWRRLLHLESAARQLTLLPHAY